MAAPYQQATLGLLEATARTVAHALGVTHILPRAPTLASPLLDCRIPEGETTAMHLVLKSADAKTSGEQQVVSSK
jgi:hypothetical protein